MAVSVTTKFAIVSPAGLVQGELAVTVNCPFVVSVVFEMVTRDPFVDGTTLYLLGVPPVTTNKVEFPAVPQCNIVDVGFTATGVGVGVGEGVGVGVGVGPIIDTLVVPDLPATDAVIVAV